MSLFSLQVECLLLKLPRSKNLSSEFLLKIFSAPPEFFFTKLSYLMSLIVMTTLVFCRHTVGFAMFDCSYFWQCGLSCNRVQEPSFCLFYWHWPFCISKNHPCLQQGVFSKVTEYPVYFHRNSFWGNLFYKYWVQKSFCKQLMVFWSWMICRFFQFHDFLRFLMVAVGLFPLKPCSTWFRLISLQCDNHQS